ncbi:tautomerase family protein [Pantoea allii]|uniref:tautomerase family protein n=1 Tax=Pantoea allii TaxID=574096 RepID=UPI0024B840FE|nr:tautomerase family protein [Pantoea allii]MDJ0035382.1 tautomerase family protein [Pantoea allii]
MPVTRIAISTPRFQQWREAVSDALQQSLEASFAVPRGDCFQFFDCYDDRSRIFDRHYLCDGEAGRSDDFLMFTVTAGKARSTQQKQAFYGDLIGRLEQAIGINPRDVMVIIHFTQSEDWSFSHGKMFSLTAIPHA